FKSLFSKHFIWALACFFFFEARGSDIIGGEKVPRKSMLYMVSVQNKSGHICGGFLITEDFVVTAAHCDNEKAQLSDIVKIIRLPTAKINLKENEVCKVAGWGIMENGTLTNILRVVDVPVINKKVCKKQYSVINIRLPANVICAGGYPTHKGFCQGDSGGPLVCAGLAVGIVSFNKGKCNYPKAPNVYTDISKYLLWINAILKNPNSYL
uniref:Peptidase S1 domain-containing protein n=1 Tax=Maylandia zebra TaxID=106582 RepID=A0A3P9BSG7_9CICH